MSEFNSSRWVVLAALGLPSLRSCLVVAALFGTLSSAGLASDQTGSDSGDQRRIVFPDFSILPPEGPDWRMQRGSDRVVFGKRTGAGTRTLVAVVIRHTGFDPASVGFPDYATNPEVFAAYAKAASEQSNPPREGVRVLEHVVVPDSRFGYCAREHFKIENWVSRPGSAPLIQSDWLYNCLHPGNSRVIIQISFSERSTPEESDPAVAELRERFFSGFRMLTPVAR